MKMRGLSDPSKERILPPKLSIIVVAGNNGMTSSDTVISYVMDYNRLKSSSASLVVSVLFITLG